MNTYIVVLLILQICWVITVSSFLKNKAIEPNERVVWAIVLCTLNIVGMFLYWLHSIPAICTEPGTAPESGPASDIPIKTTCGVMSDSELKDYFNSKS